MYFRWVDKKFKKHLFEEVNKEIDPQKLSDEKENRKKMKKQQQTATSSQQESPKNQGQKPHKKNKKKKWVSSVVSLCYFIFIMRKTTIYDISRMWLQTKYLRLIVSELVWNEGDDHPLKKWIESLFYPVKSAFDPDLTINNVHTGVIIPWFDGIHSG